MIVGGLTLVVSSLKELRTLAPGTPVLASRAGLLKVLGIPGDTLTAIVLGMFLIVGITPGPQLFTEHRDIVSGIYLAFALASVVMMPIMGLLAAYGAGYITRIPFQLLMGFILGLTLVGASAINNNPFDILMMVGLGFFGFLLRRGGFPLAQVVLGMVLAPLLEQNFMVSVIKVNWDLGIFHERPVALILMVATGLVIAFGVRMQRAYTRDLKRDGAGGPGSQERMRDARP